MVVVDKSISEEMLLQSGYLLTFFFLIWFVEWAFLFVTLVVLELPL